VLFFAHILFAKNGELCIRTKQDVATLQTVTVQKLSAGDEKINNKKHNSYKMLYQ